MINYVVQDGFPHLRATSVCPNVLQYTRAYLNHFTNRRGRFYHLRKRFGHCSLLFCNYRMLLSFRRMLYDLDRRARFLRGAEGASTIHKTICTLDAWQTNDKNTWSSPPQAKFFRVSVTTIYFVKESKHENSPPQAENFKDLRCWNAFL